MPTPPKPTRAQLTRRAATKRSWVARQPKAKRAAQQRAANLWQRYRITPEDFDALLASQGGTCAICKSPDPRHRYGWRVDHNHTTGKVRGILCNHCNVVLGLVNEDPVTLLQIAIYLREHDA